MDLYAENILDHYRHPRGKELVASPSVMHEEVNLSCGDTLTLTLLLQDGRITQVGWQGTGCAISQAAMSMLSEELVGKSIEDVAAMHKDDIFAMLGVPVGPRRLKCALLSLHTLQNAVKKFRGEPVQGWSETVGG